MAHSRISGANSGDSSLERHGVPAGEWGSGMCPEDGPGRELQEAPGRQAVGRGGYDPEERGSTAERAAVTAGTRCSPPVSDSLRMAGSEAQTSVLSLLAAPEACGISQAGD